jgi:hydroxymethylpyrimidine pyrophosphatase-like HAD family hydrolase
MKYAALATDYDGTIAHDGRVDDATVEALRRARQAGLRLLLVTGRELSDLSNTFAHAALFDRIVAENGAVLFDPSNQTMRLLAEPPPPALIERLTRLAIPLSVGHVIVATVEPHEHAVLDAIRDLGLEWHVIFNKGSVMALPSGVTKETGLLPALEELELDPAHTIGVGDAENDHAFLQRCGLSVAVANALPALKETAQLVTAGARGAGVVELIQSVLDGSLETPRVQS